ncbi:uncharacterized protein [Dysidea avara]
MMKGGELGMDKKFASLSELVSEKTLNVVGFTDMMEIHPKGLNGSSKDWKWKNISFSHTSCRADVQVEISPTKWHWGGGDFTN